MLNPIIAGALTGGILAFRAGLTVAAKNALIGGAILLLIEGSGVFIYQVQLKRQAAYMAAMQENQRQQAMAEEAAKARRAVNAEISETELK